MVEIIEVNTGDKVQVRQFLQLPFEIYKDVPQWVPAMDAANQLNHKKHPFYKHSDAAFLLAVRPSPRPSPTLRQAHHPQGVAQGRGSEVVGRLCILDNRNYNAFNKSKTAHFFLFDCEDNAETSGALFDAAFAWARKRGLNHVEGPKGLTALDGLGLLVKGFEHAPALGIPYNRDYYAKLIEAAGFTSKGDILSGHLAPNTLNAEVWDRIDRASELVQRRRGLRVSNFKTRGDMRKAVPQLLELYNGALGQSEGNVPFTPDEAKAMADQLIWFADPRLVKIVYKDDAPVGFLLAYPDIGEAVKKTGGKIFPFGWITLLRALRKSDWINVNGAGLLEEHRGGGGTAVLFSEMRKSVVAGGFAHADLVQIGVENAKMQRELRELGIDFYKTHRMYERKLDE